MPLHCKNLTNAYRFDITNNVLWTMPCKSIGKRCEVTDTKSLEEFRLQTLTDATAAPRRVCHQCYMAEEQDKIPSERSLAKEFIPADAVAGVAHVVDFQISKLCNAACVHCGPQYSSHWRKLEDIPGTKKSFIDEYEQSLELISLEDVRLVKFSGGEPLLGQEHIAVMAKLDPENVTLYYETNGSVFPSVEIFNTWANFKKVIVSVSVDAIGNKFEYLRWPLSWDTVSENVKRMVDMKISNLEIRLNCTVSPLNLMYLSEIEAWAYTMGLEIEFKPCNLVCGLDAAPHDMIKEFKAMGDHPVVNFFNHRASDAHKVMQLVSHLDNTDERQDMSWKNTFPEIAHFFDSYCS